MPLQDSRGFILRNTPTLAGKMDQSSPTDFAFLIDHVAEDRKGLRIRFGGWLGFLESLDPNSLNFSLNPVRQKFHKTLGIPSPLHYIRGGLHIRGKGLTEASHRGAAFPDPRCCHGICCTVWQCRMFAEGMRQSGYRHCFVAFWCGAVSDCCVHNKLLLRWFARRVQSGRNSKDT